MFLTGRRWHQMDPSKEFPANCHIGGWELSDTYNGPLYIGRKQVMQELVVGKVVVSTKLGYCKF